MHPFNCYTYYCQPGLVLLIVEGLGHNWPIVKHLNTYTYVFNIIPYNLKLDHLREQVKQWSLLKLEEVDFKKQIVWLMNTRQQVDWASSLGLEALFVNHNCWLDSDLYKITGLEKRMYDVVINSRPFRWKRVYLADKIESLAYIKGGDYTNGKQWFWSPWYRLYSYVNLKPIGDPCLVNLILNQAKIGVILSGNTGDDKQEDFEGACYSSSEYLLAGLRVISTPSEGGREVWYNSYNSIICQPTREGVESAYRAMLSQIENNLIDREKIREGHIKLQLEMRETFISYTKTLFQKHGIEIDPDELFKKRFINKMTCYNSSPEDIIQILESPY